MTARIKNPLSRVSTGGRDVTSSLARGPVMRWVARLALAVVVVAGSASLFFFPLMDFVTQRSAIAERNSEFNALADANEQLQTEVNALQTPEGIRNAARAQLGYVLPGEQRLSLVPMAALPTNLPPTWPYTLISDILKVRTLLNSTSDRPLAPLAP